MKKLFVILGAASAMVFAGCNKGGTSDQYETSSGEVDGSVSSNSVHNVVGSTNLTVNP